MKAIIMAGGAGSRLRPLTCDRPKPIVPVINKPIMEYGIELLKKHGIFEIGVTLQYMPHMIIDHFGDGSKWGVNLHYFIEESPLGTAGSIKNAEKFLDEPFIVISGDALTDFNLSSVIDFHNKNEAFVTIVLTKVDNPLEYGIVITDEEQKIVSFLEKPSWGEVFSDTVNTGIYVIEPEVLQMIPSKGMFDFSKDLFPKILSQGKRLFGCNTEGYWCDIGNIRQYHQAHIDILNNKVDVEISGHEISPNVWVEKDCDISDKAHLEGPLYIGENVKIGPGVNLGPYCVLGKNCVLDDTASLKRALLWDSVFIGHGAEIRGSLLLNRVKVKDYANIYEGATIGDDTVIEENATIKPDVKVWPNKLVCQGNILTESLVWGTRAARRIFGHEGISGTANIDITPEFAARIGAAFSSTRPKEAQILVGCEGVSSARMLKEALVSGLLSCGLQVIDIGNSITPITRYAVNKLGVHSGIHIKQAQDKITFVLLDKFGANISRSDERKIENYFVREDFRRMPHEGIREKVYFPNIIQSYLNRIFNDTHTNPTNSNLRILVEYDAARLGGFISSIFDALSAEILYFADNGKSKHLVQEFSKAIRNYDADFGVIFDPHGESLILIDKTGRIITAEEYEALLALLVVTEQPQAKVVLPFHAPNATDKLAQKHSAQILRSKTSLRDWMQLALENEVISTQGEKNQFILRLDALYAFVTLTNYLSRRNTHLHHLLDELPEFNYCKKEIACPFEKKGSVMRKLIEEGRKGKSELLDGVKIYHDDGWALVLPDNEQAICKIYSEAASMEAAEELAGLYIDKIKEYRK